MRWSRAGAPTARVVTEPTDLHVAVAHKGFEWVEIETEGRAAHGSRPREGRDAIRLMGRVLDGLDALDRELQSRPPHALLGTASLHASLIDGGRELSSYPDRCHLQMERRTIPGEAPGARRQGSAKRCWRACAREDPDFKAAQPRDVRALAVRDRRRPRTAAGDARARGPAVGRRASRSACSSGPMPPVLGDAGIPSILFGPDRRGLHSVEEWVDVQVGADLPRRARQPRARLVPLNELHGHGHWQRSCTGN